MCPWPSCSASPILLRLDASCTLKSWFGRTVVDRGLLASSTRRRINTLQARLSDCLRLTALGSVGNMYRHISAGSEVPISKEDESLEVYRRLDASRLKSVGPGHWDPSDYLPDDLWLWLAYKSRHHSAPRRKRLALADISVQLARLPATTDAACLIGGWVTVLAYRRQGFCCLDRVFQPCPSASLDPAHPKIAQLPRMVAQELLLISAIALVSHVSAPFSPEAVCD